MKDAVDYELQIYDVNAGQLVESTDSTNGNHFYALQNSLANGSYQLFVRGISNLGETGEWAKIEFGILFDDSVSQIDSANISEKRVFIDSKSITSNSEFIAPEQKPNRSFSKPPIAVIENDPTLDSFWGDWPQFEWWNEKVIHDFQDTAAMGISESGHSMTFAEKTTAATLGLGTAVVLTEKRKKASLKYTQH